MEFTSQFAEGLELAYAAIPIIPTLAEPLQSQVQDAFAASLSVVWKTMVGISGIGLISVAIMKDIPLNAVLDERFGLDVKDKSEKEKAETSVAAAV